MKVILKENIDNLGSIGSVVNVKNGYARNYLFPQAKAVHLSERNQKQLEHQKRVLERLRQKKLEALRGVQGQLEKEVVQISKQVGEQDKIFGSVTTIEVADFLASKGLQVDRKTIKLPEEIKTTGTYTAEIKLDPEVIAKVSVSIIAAS